MTRPALTLLAMAASAAGSLALGAGAAHADVTAACADGFVGISCTADVVPGLHCDRNPGIFDGSITCTNTTSTAYAVIQTTNCPEGSYTMSEPHTVPGALNTYSTYYTTSDYHVAASTEHDGIFVPANDSATAYSSSCDVTDGIVVSYAVDLAPAPAAPAQ